MLQREHQNFRDAIVGRGQKKFQKYWPTEMKQWYRLLHNTIIVKKNQ